MNDNLEAQKIFSEIKQNVKQLIQNNVDKEITRNTNHKLPGVYLLYVNDFSDNKIIPFYIGQTDNFQRRHFEHLSEIMALNRLSYDNFMYYLINNYFAGQYKSIKIFSYLLSHNLRLENIRMVALEIIDDPELRTQKEVELINKLYAPFLGFNQYNTISGLSKFKPYEDTSQFIKENFAKDLENIKILFHYGYNIFNCSLINNTIETYFPNEYKLLFSDKVFNELSYHVSLSDELKKRRHELSIQIGREQQKIKNIITPYVNNFFITNGLKSKDKQKDIINYYVYDQKDTFNSIEEYIKRCSKNNKSFFNAISSEKELLEQIKEINEKLNSLNNEAVQLKTEHSNCVIKLFQLRGVWMEKYSPFPLKDLHQEAAFENRGLNTCSILVDLSTDRPNYQRDIYPTEIRFAAQLTDNIGKTITKEWFIDNCLNDFLVNDDKQYYISESFYSIHKPDPFNLTTVGVDTKISLKAEYDTGINEYTIYNHKKYSLSDVFDELSMLINSDMDLFISIPRSKSRFVSSLNFCKDENLRNRLGKASKRKK